jgi:predicted GH43/DUF377 family glycosyl hydrolase
MEKKLPQIITSEVPALVPQPGSPWADTMILNPAIIKDPNSSTLHMLFRATGPWSEKKLAEDCVDPFPILLGYAKSEDNGKTWDADFSRPALAPAVEYEIEKMYIIDDEGNKVPNYTNGCIEDPRIFEVEGQLYLTAACRMFPPGPYWLDNIKELKANRPEWSKNENNPFGKSATTNDTTTVLYKLDLEKLKNKEYDSAFQYVCPLTDSSVNDNRDVFLFSEKMMVDGKLQYVMLHRPHNPEVFDPNTSYRTPSIFLAAAENIKDFSTDKATHKFLAGSRFDWEVERIGASWAPIKINDNEWLISNHGKTWPGVGYSQSFMIVREVENSFPELIHRCPDRLMYPKHAWEMPDRFPCPCLFTTAGIVVDGELIMAYGAADQKAGIAWGNFNEIVEYVRQFDAEGNSL